MNFLSKIFTNKSNRAVSKKYSAEATDFANSNNYASPTGYLIWVDTKNFKVNIYRGSKNRWTLVNSYLCTLGKDSTPTPKGIFSIGIKGLSFGEEKGYKCFYYTSFKGNYLFHSIIYNLDGSVRDGRLGKKLSDGCIRLSKEHVKWIFDNVPANSKVVIE